MNLKTLKEFLEEGFKIKFPIRIISLGEEELVVQKYSHGLIEEVDESEKENFRQYYSKYLENGYVGILYAVVLEKNGEKILVFLDKELGRDLARELGEEENFGEEIVRFYKHYLDEVIVCKGSESEQFNKLSELVKEKRSAIYQEVVKRRLEETGEVKLFYVDDERPVNKKKIRFKLYNKLFNKKKNSNTKSAPEELLVVVVHKGERLGFIFKESDYIKKVEQMYFDVNRKVIKFDVKVVPKSKTTVLHDIDDIVKNAPKIDKFEFTKGERNDEISISVCIPPPFKDVQKIIDDYTEKLALILDFMAYELKDVGFYILRPPQILDYIDGRLTMHVGLCEYSPSFTAESKERIEKSLEINLDPKVRKALQGLNKAKIEFFPGSALKTLWATVEEVFFDEKQRKEYFDNEEINDIAECIEEKSGKNKAKKVMNILYQIKDKTKNDVIKENIHKLFPHWEKSEIDKLINKARDLRGESVHTLKEKKEECEEISSKLEEILTKLVSDSLDT